MNHPISPPDPFESDLRRFGYVELVFARHRAVVLDWAAPAVAAALGSGTLHEWASRSATRKEMQGRGVNYAVDLPTTPATPVVVRRNRHGGLLHGLNGEYFLAPTRAPYEL